MPSELPALLRRLEENISQVVLGKPEVVRLCLVTLVAGEHVLLEDVPGDTYMPDPRLSGEWREVGSEEHPAEDGRPPFRFVTLERA